MNIFEIQTELRHSVDDEKLQSWTRLRTSRVYLDLFLNWLGIVLALLLFAKFQNVLTVVAAATFIGLRQYSLFIMGHDAIHGSLHPNKRWNDNISRWTIHGPLFMGFGDMRRNHLEHHKWMGSTADPDRYVHTLTNKNTRLSFLLFCSGVATFGKTLLKVTPLGKLISRTCPTQVAEPSSNTQSTNEYLKAFAKERISVAVWQPVILLFMLSIGIAPWFYPILWVAPIYFFVFVPDEIRAFAEHACLTFDDEHADPERLITFVPNVLERAYFSPNNMNYHAEHHVWPRVPYYNLPAVHTQIKDAQHVVVRRSYLEFGSKVFAFLPR